jgi:hypothetical protein
MISLQIYHKSYNLCAIASKLSKIFSTSTRSFLPFLSPRFRWGCKGISLFITNKLFLDFFRKFFSLFALPFHFSFFLNLTHLLAFQTKLFEELLPCFLERAAKVGGRYCFTKFILYFFKDYLRESVGNIFRRTSLLNNRIG